MTDPVPAQLVMRFRKATGLPVLMAREVLAGIEPNGREAYVAALENSGSRILHDPIEDDPTIGPIIATVLREAETEADAIRARRIAEAEATCPTMVPMIRAGLGTCHLIWAIARRKLKEEHGIEWRSPAQMMPWTMFD